MLRRLSVIAASAAMLAASALPAFATTSIAHSSTHKLSFPGHSGIQAWGNYKKTNKGIYVNVCAKDTKRQFAVGAVIVVSLQEYLSDLVGAWVSVIIGAIFVICVMVFRRGIVGEIQRRCVLSDRPTSSS